MSELRIGLVLSGGGAKGAYQAGVVRALAELGTQVDAVAGASIGALNGAILASAPSLAEGASRMQEVWETLASEPPLRHNLPAYVKLALAGGMALSLGQFGPFARTLGSMASSAGIALPAFLSDLSGGLLCSGPLHELTARYLDPQALQQGIPLHVSVFETGGGAHDLIAAIAAELGLRDSAASAFLHIQSLPLDERRAALLASAAIPVLFGAQAVNGKRYTDGGLGGWQTSQGNTPITPLRDAGIRNVIVTHLSDSSLWSRHSFRDINVIEIRPQTPIRRDGGHRDLLGFDQSKISSWIEQGYQDAYVCLKRVVDASASLSELRQSEHALRQEADSQGMDDDALAEMLAGLRRH